MAGIIDDWRIAVAGDVGEAFGRRWFGGRAVGMEEFFLGDQLRQELLDVGRSPLDFDLDFSGSIANPPRQPVADTPPMKGNVGVQS